jgi:uncharacterized protein
MSTYTAIAEQEAKQRDEAKIMAGQSERGAWIQTFTGRAFYPLDPRPEDIDIRDVAHALSMQCRFTGHTKSFYSVAEHSLRVSWLIDQRNGFDQTSTYQPGDQHHPAALWGLLHDASEAFLVDVARPVKHLPAMNHYRIAEKAAMRAICQRYDLNEIEPPQVKEADNIMLAIEARDLMSPLRPGWEQWDRFIAMAPERYKILKPLTPELAETAFLTRFAALGGQ